MSIYNPPTEILTIFNQDNYLLSGDYLTIGIADKRYLKLSGGTLTGLLTASAGIYSTLYSAADGSFTAPTYTFSSDTGVGMYYTSGGGVGLAWGGASIMQIDSVAGIKVTTSGDVTFPQYSFVSDSQTGLYRPASQQVGITCNATSITTWSTTAMSLLKPIYMPNGTAASPSLSFTNSVNTGVYRVAADVIGFSSASNLIAQVSASALSAKQLTITNTSAYANQSVSTTGAFLNVVGNTITATNNSDMAFCAIQRPTLAASGTQTTTNAYTLYIGGSPSAGTNETITNAYGILVDTPGVVRILDTTASSSSTTGALQVLGGAYFGSSCRYNSNITMQGTSAILTLSGTSSSIASSGTTASTSNTTGALTLAGGIGISNTTDASSSTNGGTLTTAGGAAIAKTIYIGGSCVTSTYEMVGSTSNIGAKGRLQTSGYNSDASERCFVAIQNNRSTGNASYFRIARLGTTDDGTVVLGNNYGRPAGTFTADNTSLGVTSVEYNTAGYLTFGTGAASANQTTERMRIFSGGGVAINTTTQNGTDQLTVSGTCSNTSGVWAVISDSRVKTDVSDFTDSLDVLKRLNPKVFKYNEKSNYSLDVQAEEQVGLVADELEQVIPQAIRKNKRTVKRYNREKNAMEDDPDKSFDDLRSVNPQRLLYILINAVKELAEKIGA